MEGTGQQTPDRKHGQAETRGKDSQGAIGLLRPIARSPLLLGHRPRQTGRSKHDGSVPALKNRKEEQRTATTPQGVLALPNQCNVIQSRIVTTENPLRKEDVGTARGTIIGDSIRQGVGDCPAMFSRPKPPTNSPDEPHYEGASHVRIPNGRRKAELSAGAVPSSHAHTKARRSE